MYYIWGNTLQYSNPMGILWEFGIPTCGNPMGIPTEILRE